MSLWLPVGVAVVGVCDCASGRGPMSQGGFSRLAYGVILDTGEILGRSSAGARWCGANDDVWLWLLLLPPSVPQPDLHPTHRSASSQRAPAQRRRRNNTPTPQIPPPLRQHTTTAPPALNIHNPPPPLRPVVLVSLRPACILRHALSQGRACAFLPRLLPRIYVRRGHTDPLSCPSRQQPRRPLNAFATGHTAKQIACHRYPHAL